MQVGGVPEMVSSQFVMGRKAGSNARVARAFRSRRDSGCEGAWGTATLIAGAVGFVLGVGVGVGLVLDALGDGDGLALGVGGGGARRARGAEAPTRSSAIMLTRASRNTGRRSPRRRFSIMAPGTPVRCCRSSRYEPAGRTSMGQP